MRKLAPILAAVAVAMSSCALSACTAAAATAKAPVAGVSTTEHRAAAPPQTPAPPVLPVTGASLLVSGADAPLWSYNGDAELAIASTTKLMTFLVVVQRVHDLNTVFTQNHWDPQAADSQIGLVPGERMTVRDLLEALMLPSADDAAEDLAYNVGGGSVPQFIQWMNTDARALGLAHTHYSTPIGLDTAGNYSSPDDLVHLADHLMRDYPLFRQIVGTDRATITDVGGDKTYHLVNTDDLLAHYSWIHGVKTGHTTDAGYVLVSQATRDGLTLVSSVLGTDSEYERDQSALRLLDWGFATYAAVTPVRAGAVLARPPVAYASVPAELVAAHGYHTVIRRGTRIRVSVGRSRARTLSGPLSKGTRVGYVRVRIAGRPTVRIPLVLAHALPSVSVITKVAHAIGRPITLLWLALALLAAALWVGWHRRTRRRRDRRARIRAPR